MNLTDYILPFVTLIISLTVHEAAHALVAYWGGDRTAYQAGQVTLNPLPHIQREPFGMIALPLITLLSSKGVYCFGFAHAPYDPYWAARHPHRAALMSVAGPVGNILLATIAFAVLWYVGKDDSGTEAAIREIGTRFLLLNLFLALFNLVPLPPLDGAGIVRGLYPPSGRLFDLIAGIPYGTLVVIVLLSNWIGELFRPVYYAVDRLLPYSTLW